MRSKGQADAPAHRSNPATIGLRFFSPPSSTLFPTFGIAFVFASLDKLFRLRVSIPVH
ncbi:hypothetical protein ALC60_13529 [Trachymyrmex zeteki]|uniref:Uncharacterized protein n=1 Tax=Mycetomoellerius zeteki TaxID=64791 RepID=A0A151WHW3_9HYME|nr:hypothetical protein ALC60_13529 [Trachymyrmex zeteki]